MAQSLSEQLRELSNPRPAEFHPDQDDWDLLTGARVTSGHAYDGDEIAAEEGGVASRRHMRTRSSSRIRKRQLELEDDPRYAGRPVSRKELYGSGQDNGDSDDERVTEVDQSDNELESGDEQEELDGARVLIDDIIADRSDLSESDQSESPDENGQEEGEEMASNERPVEGSGFAAVDVDRVREDLEKGRAVKEQITLWDGVLEGRIKMHKSLCLSNSLPQPSHMPAFLAAGGDRAATAVQDLHKELTSLLDSLLQLQRSLLLRHKDTRSLVCGGGRPAKQTEEDRVTECDDEEVPSDFDSNDDSDQHEGAEEGEEKGIGRKRRRRKRKCPWRTSGYEDHISHTHSAFQSYQDETIAKWDTKIRLASGKLTNKAFVQVDRSALAQIKHVLQDKDRLVKRTQLKRSVYRVLGKEEEAEGEGMSHDSHLKSHDEEIYDEDDFYHQLLRDLIERKMNYAESADPVTMGRQWLELQKLRSKVKKKVDTKASKGRKIRYDVHPKLVGFMAPIERGTLSNSSRNDLFISLFGAHSQRTHDEQTISR